MPRIAGKSLNSVRGMFQIFAGFVRLYVCHVYDTSTFLVSERTSATTMFGRHPGRLSVKNSERWCISLAKSQFVVTRRVALGVTKRIILLKVVIFVSRLFCKGTKRYEILS